MWDAREQVYRMKLAAQYKALARQFEVAALPGTGNPLYYRTLGRWDLFEPTWSCESEERVGTMRERYDAFGEDLKGAHAKFACGIDALKSPCLVYSIGPSDVGQSARYAGRDIPFEKSMRELTDCEIRSIPMTLGKGETGSGRQSLLATMKSLGDDGRRIDVLRVHCDGCEWEVMVPAFNDVARGALEIGECQLLSSDH